MKGKGYLRPLTMYSIVLCTLGFLLLGAVPAATAAPQTLKGVSYNVMSKAELALVAYQMFIDKINERASGKLKVEYLGGPEVIPAGEQMTALSKGVVQLLVIPGYHSSIVPEINATLVSDITPVEQRTVGFYDLMVDIHRKKLGVLPLSRVDYGIPFYLYTKANVQKLDDLRGLKFRSNANYDPLFKELGIVSVAMPGSEIYTALERGLVVGFPWPAFITQLRLQEVVDKVIDHGWWGGGAIYIYMNAKVFDNLEPALQKIIVEVSKEVEAESMAKASSLIQEERDRLTAAGVKFVKLPDGKELQKIAADVRWKDIVKASPDLGPKMREMISKK